MSAKSTETPFSRQRRENSWQIGGNISTCFNIGTIRPMDVILRATNVPTPLRDLTSRICFRDSIALTAVRCDTPNRRHIIFTDGNAEPGAYLPESTSSRSLSATSRYLGRPPESSTTSDLVVRMARIIPKNCEATVGPVPGGNFFSRHSSPWPMPMRTAHALRRKSEGPGPGADFIFAAISLCFVKISAARQRQPFIPASSAPHEYERVAGLGQDSIGGVSVAGRRE